MDRGDVLPHETLDALGEIALIRGVRHARPIPTTRRTRSTHPLNGYLAENAEVRERRNQLRHPAYSKPELLATAPNQLWSWDITKLLGPAKWTYFYLYVILDVFSRYVVGWMVADAESSRLAQHRRDVHAAGHRGWPAHHPCRPRLVDDLQARRDVAGRPGHHQDDSLPHVSDDNPFSEAHFKTMKYRPDFPERFGEIEDARGYSRISSAGTTTSIITPASAC